MKNKQNWNTSSNDTSLQTRIYKRKNMFSKTGVYEYNTNTEKQRRTNKKKMEAATKQFINMTDQTYQGRAEN